VGWGPFSVGSGVSSSAGVSLLGVFTSPFPGVSFELPVLDGFALALAPLLTVGVVVPPSSSSPQATASAATAIVAKSAMISFRM
jgi:hypothetical protein